MPAVVVYILVALGGGAATYTALDLFGPKALPACDIEYIEAHGNALCREQMTCSEGGKGSATSCDAVANINNTDHMRAVCEKLKGDERKDCYDAYRFRK